MRRSVHIKQTGTEPQRLLNKRAPACSKIPWMQPARKGAAVAIGTNPHGQNMSPPHASRRRRFRGAASFVSTPIATLIYHGFWPGHRLSSMHPVSLMCSSSCLFRLTMSLPCICKPHPGHVRLSLGKSGRVGLATAQWLSPCCGGLTASAMSIVGGLFGARSEGSPSCRAQMPSQVEDSRPGRTEGGTRDTNQVVNRLCL